MRFPPFRLDLIDERLWRGSLAVSLPPKAFAVLRHLAQHHGRLVTKDDLLDAVWPGVHVGDAVLKVCVRDIRKALDDPARSPRFIQTVHRRGYRFIGAMGDIADPELAIVESEQATMLADGTPNRPPAQSGLDGRFRQRGPTHLVGREPVLDRLQMWLGAAWRGTRQIVFVAGEPGIGKTAVVEAFLERVAADRRVWIAHGQCAESYGSGEPYLPVLDALGRLCREVGGDWLVALLRQYAPTWLVQMPWLLHTTDRDALQRELLGATRERMLREMAEAVEALTAEAPLVLLVEDLHWSDPATLDLLSLLARRQEPARLLLIGTCRDEVIAARHPLEEMKLDLLTRGRCQELSLELLGEAAVADYLRERFPRSSLPSELARVIHQRTEGNSLFMVSLVDDLVARGLLTVRDGRWELRAALEEVEMDVPESLRQMIERQIGRLERDEQRILEAGSVAGMEFSSAAVAPAIEWKPLEVEERCDELARRQFFIRALGAREWPDRTLAGRYGFMHALYRKTLYRRISPARRRALHQSIGEREEAGHGERAREIAPGLAVHFEEGGDDRRAVQYLKQAAEIAMRRHANREAVGHLRRALDIAERLPEAEGVAPRLDLLEQLGLARRSMGDVSRAVEDFANLATSARELGRTREEARALLYLASALAWIDRERALAAVEQALTLACRLPDLVLQAHIRGYCGVQRILSGGWRDDDAEACRAAVAAAREAGDRRPLGLHVGNLAYLQSHQSEYRAAARTAEEGLRLALEANDAYQYMTCQFHRGWALLHVGEWGATRGILRDGLQMAEQNGHHLWTRAFRAQMAWLLTHACDFAGARALCERALEPIQGAPLGELFGSVVLGFAHLGSKSYPDALRAFEEVTARCEKRPVPMDWILQMPLRLGLSECWLARRAFGRVRDQAEELCRLAATSGERTYLALGRRALAQAALAEGDRPGADRELAEALGVLEGHEVPLAEWRVCATAARSEQARGREVRAKAYWARSAAALDRLAGSLGDDSDLGQAFLGHPTVRAICRKAGLAGTSTSGIRIPRAGS